MSSLPMKLSSVIILIPGRQMVAGSSVTVSTSARSFSPVNLGKKSTTTLYKIYEMTTKQTK